MNEKTALEKIESIKKRDHYALLDFTVDDLNFLLKSFDVMRTMGLEIMGNMVEGDGLKFDDVDKEFNKRMKKGDK